jgi:hypothetical protein
MMKVLPAGSSLTTQQRQAIERKATTMENSLRATPEASPVFAAKTAECFSKMMMVLAGRESGEFAGAAKGEAYTIALNDVPFWAVEEAMRKWYRRDCDVGADVFDYRWMPDPGSLRQVARQEECFVRYLASQVRLLLTAPSLVVEDEAELRAMRDKIYSLNIKLKAVG